MRRAVAVMAAMALVVLPSPVAGQGSLDLARFESLRRIDSTPLHNAVADLFEGGPGLDKALAEPVLAALATQKGTLSTITPQECWLSAYLAYHEMLTTMSNAMMLLTFDNEEGAVLLMVPVYSDETSRWNDPVDPSCVE